jgi:hypothetical protein
MFSHIQEDLLGKLVSIMKRLEDTYLTAAFYVYVLTAGLGWSLLMANTIKMNSTLNGIK